MQVTERLADQRQRADEFAAGVVRLEQQCHELQRQAEQEAAHRKQSEAELSSARAQVLELQTQLSRQSTAR